MTDSEIVTAEIRAAEVPMSDALGAALDRLQKDAERYRWLRNSATIGTVHLQTLDGWCYYHSAADETVDAAMAASAGAA